MPTVSKKTNAKSAYVIGRFSPIGTGLKSRKVLVRGGSRLRVAKAVTGDDAVDVLKAAGILTATGKLSTSFS